MRKRGLETELLMFRCALSSCQAALTEAVRRNRELESLVAATNERMAAILECADRTTLQAGIDRFERDSDRIEQPLLRSTIVG